MSEEKKKLNERIKDSLLASKQLAEALNVQLHLGAAEAREEFEKQKKYLGEWLNTAENNLDAAKDVSQEKAKELKTLIDSLRVQAALGKAEAGDKWNEQQEKLYKGVWELRQEFDKVKSSLGEFADEADDTLENFQTRFDLFRVQLNLGKAETQELWEAKQKEIAAKLQDLKTRLSEEEKVAAERWDVFAGEMKTAWSHVKNAFKA